MRLPSFLYILTVLILIFSCASPDRSYWTMSDEGIKLYSTEIDTTKSCIWNGNSFEEIANGEGTLKYSDYSGNIIEKKVDAFYGTVNTADVNILDDGSKYVGTLIEGMMSGYGVLVQNNTVYIGEFSNSKPNGYLKLFKGNNLYYDGYWTDGSFDGEGTLYKEDGTVKSGTWDKGRLKQSLVDVVSPSGHYKGFASEGKPDGLGKMEYKNGSSYQGKWSNGTWSGEGLYISGSDSVYGIWEQGKVCGHVIYRSNDFFYEGTFDNNSPIGVGTLTTRDGSFYSGNWFEGKRNGMGDMVFQNGDTYSGEWENNSFQGYGEYHYNAPNGIYKGDWKEGLQDGNGYYKSDDFSYNGQWEKGWMDGDGVLIFKNKDKYEGSIHENIIDGIGCYTFANGNRYEGEFVNGKINGLGVFQFKNGNRFEGEFVNGKIYGDGTLYLKEKNGYVAITGFWPYDGTYPKEASILFENGDLYEGPLIDGKPTESGTWTSGEQRKAQIDKIENSAAHKANEFYKKHRETINCYLLGVSAVVTGVEIACASTAVGVIVVPVIHGVNVAVNVADASMAIASAAIDVYENEQLGEDNTEATKALATEVGMNAAFILVPKVVSKAAKPLGKAVKNIKRSTAASLLMNGKNIAKKSAITFVKGKIVGKVTKISISVQSGVQKVEKTLIRSKATRNITIATGRLFTGIKDQTVKFSSYLNKINNNPGLKEQLKLSAEGSSKNLGDNMRLLGSDKWVKQNERIRRYLNMPKRQVEPHHIIPSNPTTEQGRQARKIWTKYFDSVDHPCNGIWLGRSNKKLGYKALAKGTNHSPNSYEYEQYVSKALIDTYKKHQKQYAKNPEMMQKVLAETVDNLKDQLYKGKLSIGSGSHQVHTPWSIFKDQGIIAAEANNIVSSINKMSN